jgi:hypothetical protein
LGFVGCGGGPVVKNTSSPIAVDDSKAAFVKKALSDAKVEGEVVSIDFYNEKYEVMVAPPQSTEAVSKTESGDVVGGVRTVRPPSSYTITKDGKVKKNM